MGAAGELTEATWARWAPTAPFTLGVEEEVMLLDPWTWALAQAIDEVLPRLPGSVARRVTAETHAAAAELATGVHRSVAGAVAELRQLRGAMKETCAECGLAVASAGTHPFTVWRETSVSSGARYELIYGSMRELARREPTFALHVHVGVPDPEDAIRAVNGMRAHLPVLLALSANSPFWQGRDSGLASARTPLFQAFPRVGIPRRFADYADYVRSVDLLLRLEAFPEPTFLWWDVRPQPRFGTVEVRIMDAQTRLPDAAALAALVQSLVRLYADGGWPRDAPTPELLAENRFIAARDGMAARFIEPSGSRTAHEWLAERLDGCRPVARELDATAELATLDALAADGPYLRQRAVAARLGVHGLAADLSARFANTAPAAVPV
jgi:carboxylate-amine ligase